MSFSANGEKIPLLVDQPVQSLGRRYTADLSSKQMAVSVSSQLADGLSKINQTTREIQDLVLAVYFVLSLDVAPEVVWHYLNNSPEDGLKSQKLHPKMAGPPSLPFWYSADWP